MPRRGSLPTVIGLAIQLGALPACAPAVPELGRVADPGRIRIAVAPWASRHVLTRSPSTGVRVVLDGPGLATPLVQDATMSAEATATLSLEGIPPGPNRTVAVLPLDPQGTPEATAALWTSATVLPGALATASLGEMSTPRGRILQALLERDRASDTHVAADLDATSLQAFVDEEVRAFAKSPWLVDGTAITLAITSTGRVPLPASRFALSSGEVAVTLRGVPPSATGRVWVDDPLSEAQIVDQDGSWRLTSVVPGRWTVRVDLPGTGLHAERAIQVEAGAREAVTFDLVAHRTLSSPLSMGLAAPACVVTGAAPESLLLVGGWTSSPSVSAAATTWSFDGEQVHPGPDLAAGVSFAQAVAASDDVYVLGGMVDHGAGLRTTDAVMRLTRGAWSRVATLPAPRAMSGAWLLGSKLYCVSGFKDTWWGLAGTDPGSHEASDFNAGNLRAWDLVTRSWSDLAPLATPRGAMASATVGSRGYVFGGLVFRSGSGSRNQAVVANADSYAPGSSWRTEPRMPTPRAGATAVVVGDRVWVIGGCDDGGAALPCVEVYDTVTRSWTLRPPLERARGYVAAGLVGGRIAVLGGGECIGFSLLGHASRVLEWLDPVAP